MSALMPAEDFRIFHAVRASRGSIDSHLQWLRRRWSQERLYVRVPSNQSPPILGLEWSEPAFSPWAGWLPRPAAPQPAR